MCFAAVILGFPLTAYFRSAVLKLLFNQPGTESSVLRDELSCRHSVYRSAAQHIQIILCSRNTNLATFSDLPANPLSSRCTLVATAMLSVP